MALGVDDVTVDPSPGQLSSRAAVRALTIGSVALISLTAFEALAVATVMPAVAADLSGLPLYALAFGAPLATSVVGMALAGAWSDGVGPRRPLAVGVGLLAVGLLICGSAPTMPLFVTGRGVQGLGAGMLNVAIYALVGSVVPEPLRPKLFAYFAAAWVLPAMIGPAISGLILHALGWRAVFLLVPALAIPAGATMAPALRGVHRPARRTSSGAASGSASDSGTTGTDAAGVRRRVLLAIGAGTSAAVLQVAGSRSGLGWRGVMLVTLPLVVWCAWRLLPPGTLTLRRGVSAVIAARGLIGAAFTGGEAYLPLLLVRERGWEPTIAGLTLTVTAFAWSATAWIQGRLPDIAARYRFSRIGTALLLVGVISCWVAAAPGVPGLVAVIGWTIGGGGMGLVYSSTSLLTLHLSPPERQGTASSALTTSEALTSAIVLALGGAAFAALLPAGLAANRPAGSPPYLAGISVAVIAAALSTAAAWRFSTRSRASSM